MSVARTFLLNCTYTDTIGLNVHHKLNLLHGTKCIFNDVASRKRLMSMYNRLTSISVIYFYIVFLVCFLTVCLQYAKEAYYSITAEVQSLALLL